MNQPLTTSLSPAQGSTMHRIAIVSASWHRDIVHNAVEGIRTEYARRRPGQHQIDQFEVPGAFEIPLHLQRLARSGRYDALIACGLVVNGGIYRHEFVSSAVIDALMRIQLDTGVPVFSVVLTPRDFHAHEEHQNFFRTHFITKGQEAAQACLATLDSLSALPA